MIEILVGGIIGFGILSLDIRSTPGRVLPGWLFSFVFAHTSLLKPWLFKAKQANCGPVFA